MNERNHFIVLKEYIQEKDFHQIDELKNICADYEKVNLKLELDYRLGMKKEEKKSMGAINEFLYFVDDLLVGYLGIASFGGNAGEITGMTHPAWRRRGIGKKLLALVREECGKRNFKKVLLVCDAASGSGTGFVKASGSVYSFSEYGMNVANKQNVPDSRVVNLRKAEKADGREIARQNAIYFGDVEGPVIVPEDAAVDNNTYMVELNGTTIGKIRVDTDGDSAFIGGFGILPEFRSRGYGREALTAALHMLAKSGICNVSLDVACENANALSLYKSCGFMEHSVMDYYEDKQPERESRN
jgi:ribosomal protein S18 acetylase RimI-like enzyme